MQLASRNPPCQDRFLLIRQFFLQGLLGQNALLALARSFASRNFRENQKTPAISRGVSEEKQTPGALAFGSRKASLLEVWLLHVELVS